MKRKRLTDEERLKKKVERFKNQNINPYPLPSVTLKDVKRASRKSIARRKSARPSEAERVIGKWLFDNRIESKREWYFDDCFNPISGRLLFFDFYLPRFRAVIEFDGIFHYKGKDLDKQRFNDETKNQYCKKRKIPLLRIPYFDSKILPELLEEFIIELEALKR